jgi:hypothetical protein
MPLLCSGDADARLPATTSMATRLREQPHVQIRDLMKSSGRVKVGQPGTVTGGKRR